MKTHLYQREARELAENNGWAWTRAQRRRLARSVAGPGRRFASRVPKITSLMSGFTRTGVETMALLAVPGLRRRDVRVRTPQPGSVLVELSGPGANVSAVELVRVALDGRTPIYIELDVVAVGGVAS